MNRYLGHILLLLALFLGSPAHVHAQGNSEAHTRIADRYFQRMAYAQARAEYMKAADLGAVNEHVVKRLAICAMKLGDTREGERWYGQVVKFLNREPQDLYMYAEALKGNGKYGQAEEWMDRYLGMVQPEGAGRKSNIVDFARKFTTNLDRFTVKQVSANSPMDDLAATWDGTDRVIFASARDTTVGIQWRAAWDHQPFLDLYVAGVQADGDLVGARRLPGNVNSKLHEGPAVVAPDGTLWYTRTNAAKGKSGIHRLSILHARRDGDGWMGSDPFLYNNPECSVGHPAISADGRWFFFISDMPGGYGGTDIYVCENRGGQWGEPRNLGPGVNTAHNELFPFMSADGTLYFSSNGLPGLGGLDVFAAKRGANGQFAFAINVGAPVNGPKDDFAFVVDPAGSKGYFTSNRPGGAGGDDLYAFTMHYPLEQRFLCTGTVVDDDNGQPVADAAVDLLDADGNVEETGRSAADGRYSFPVKENKEYAIRARMAGHYDGLVHFSTEDIGQQQIVARDVHVIPDAGIWLRGTVQYKDKIGFVEGVKVSVVNLASFFSDVRTTEAGGDFLFRLQPNEQFEVMLEKPGFFTVSVPVATMGMSRGIIELGPMKEDLAMEEVEVGRALPLKYVKWTSADNNLAPAAKAELDALADRVQVNPALKFEVAVHADTRLGADAALKLTQARAKVTEDYLRAKGIRKEQLVVQAYGTTKPTNPCGAGVECTAAQHAENERVEYKVTAVSGL
ncbi:MAG TPA: carboxypeptidase regulatory-like domain-containing protein [Flavobacteriales bacterium]|nr:carboxypeptidase regulatory-like domain-containing protein [Flavobacteriales bacterium]